MTKSTQNSKVLLGGDPKVLNSSNYDLIYFKNETGELCVYQEDPNSGKFTFYNLSCEVSEDEP